MTTLLHIKGTITLNQKIMTYTQQNKIEKLRESVETKFRKWQTTSRATHRAQHDKAASSWIAANDKLEQYQDSL
jgi:hypothetical protein